MLSHRAFRQFAMTQSRRRLDSLTAAFALMSVLFPTLGNAQIRSIPTSPIPPKHIQPSPIQPSPIQPSPIQPIPIQPSPIQPSPIQPSFISPPSIADPCASLNSQLGFVAIDLPEGVNQNEPFVADVSLQPCRNAPKTPVAVRMEQTSDTEYNPRIMWLEPGDHRLVTITIKKSEGGLAQIIATPERSWLPLYASLNVGFSAVLRPRMEETMEAGAMQPVSLDFVDSNGRPVSLGAPVTVTLAVQKALIRPTAKSPWSETLTLYLEKGITSTPSVQLKAQAAAPDRALLAAVVKLNGDLILRDQKFSLTIIPQWWLQLLVGIFGGLLHATSKTLVDYSQARRRPRFIRLATVKLLTGALAGCFAYLLASWNVLGIRIDTTSLRAFALMGFLFSYIGIDAIVGRFLPRERGITATHVASFEGDGG